MKIKKGIEMERGSTIILRLAVIAIGLIVAALCVGVGFLIFDGEQNYRTPVWALLWVAAVPFFIALFQTLRLLNYIDKNKAFSRRSVKALKNIKHCGLAISGLFVAGSPYVMYTAQRDDSPGFFAAALVLIGASFTVAVFAAVLQRLLQNAITIKKENDLTV